MNDSNQTWQIDVRVLEPGALFMVCYAQHLVVRTRQLPGQVTEILHRRSNAQGKLIYSHFCHGARVRVPVL